MGKHFWSYALIVILTLVLSETFHPLAAMNTVAQGNCQTFAETGKTVCGRFLEYWRTHGGLAQQGFPISAEFTEVSDLNGQAYTVQYFERAVFEKHPENAAPNDVLLSQLGTFQFKRKYPNGEPGATAPPPAPPTPTTATSPPAQGEQPITFEGSRDVNTAPFSLQGGMYEISWSLDLEGESQTLFTVWLRGTNGNYAELLVNTIVQQGDPTTGTDLVYNVPPGQYYLEIENSRETHWRVTLAHR